MAMVDGLKRCTNMFIEEIIIPEEFEHFTKVLYRAAQGKYEPNNWLQVSGINADRKSAFASVHRHVAQAQFGKHIDNETGLPHILHAIARLQMIHVRNVRGIVHPEDINNDYRY